MKVCTYLLWGSGESVYLTRAEKRCTVVSERKLSSRNLRVLQEGVLNYPKLACSYITVTSLPWKVGKLKGRWELSPENWVLADFNLKSTGPLFLVLEPLGFA